jgi:hypothetical protein
MGSNPTGPGSSTEESAEETPDQTTDTTLEEYDSEESPPVSPPVEEGSSAAGGAGGAASTAGAAGAAGGAGGSAGVAGGAPATGTTDGSDEEPTGAPGGEVTEPETPEEDESTEEADTTSPQTFEPDEPPEHEPADPEPENTEESEQEESDDRDDEEPEIEDADVLIRTDPWDTTGWGNEPDIRELEETYGPMVSVSYEVLPPRRLDDWDTSISMPLTNDPEIPNDTTASYRALTASRQQGLFRPYLRRLRIAALCEGRNVEDEATLLELADEVGIDLDQLQEDMENVDADEVEYIKEVPQMDVTIGDLEHDWTENVEFGRMHARMLGEGVTPLPIHRPLDEFVSEYEPVTTQEVDQALDIAPSELASNSRIEPVDYEGGEFLRMQ